jgi:hypothetical protein
LLLPHELLGEVVRVVLLRANVDRLLMALHG